MLNKNKLNVFFIPFLKTPFKTPFLVPKVPSDKANHTCENMYAINVFNKETSWPLSLCTNYYLT